MGQDDTVESIMLYVRGGDLDVGFVAELLQTLGLRAIDCSNGELF